MTGEGLTRRIGIVAVGRAASTFSIFAVNAILARAWPEAEVGVFRAVWVLSNTLVPIFLLGLPTSLLYFFPRRSADDRAMLMRQTLFCLLLSGGLLAVLLYLVGPQLAAWLRIESSSGQVDLAAFLLPFLPYIFCLIAGGFVESALVAAGRSHWAAGLAMALAAGLIGATWAGAALELGVKQVLLAFSLLGVVRLLAGLCLVGWAAGFGGGQSGRTWAGLGHYLSYSWTIGLNDAVGSLSRSVDRFVVLFFFGAETFAHYDLGAIEVPVSLLLAAVVTVLVPEVSRLYREERLEEIGALWRQAVSRLSLVVLPLFFFLFFFADPVIAVYLPEEYARTEWVFRIFLLALPLRCAIYNPLLVGMGKAHWALWCGLGDLLLNLFLSLVFVQILQEERPQWAFLGPALATVIATYVQVCFLVGLIGRHLRWGLARLLPWRSLLRTGLFSGAFALVALGVAGFVEKAGMKLILGGAVFAILLAGVMWAHPQNRKELKQVFRGLLRH